MRKSVVSFVLFGLLGGCAGATSPVASDVLLTPVKPAFVVGDLVTAKVSNRSSDNIEFGSCSLRAQRRVDSTWQLVGPDAVPCSLTLHGLSRGGEVTMGVVQPPVEPGEYRLVFGYWRGDSGHHENKISYSSPFSVLSAQ